MESLQICSSSIERINQRVNEQLSGSHESIVLSVFQHMLKKHNEYGTCDCNYCYALNKYVSMKKYLHMIKNDMCKEYGCKTYSPDAVEEQRYKIKQFKKYKDSLKLI